VNISDSERARLRALAADCEGAARRLLGMAATMRQLLGDAEALRTVLEMSARLDTDPEEQGR
jgi:hypothetical protein